MCTVDYEEASVYFTRERKARKEHVCIECRRTIKVREKYHHAFGVWGGVCDTFKTCSNCIEPQEWLRKECGGFLHGDLQGEIEEHAFEYKKIFLYRWLIGIRRRWQPILNDDRFLLTAGVK